MAQPTWLSLTNDVLKLLRETTVASVSTTSYSSLIGLFVNEAKEEVEDAWNWSALRDDIDMAMVIGQRNYTLTGSSYRTKILSVYNTTSKWRMNFWQNNQYLNNLISLTTTASSSPYDLDIVGSDGTTGSLIFRVNPLPTATDNLRFFTVNPTAEFDADADTLSIPKRPVIQLAYLKAINERGEDSGRASEIQEKIYKNTLATAIAQDAAFFEDETTWRAV